MSAPHAGRSPPTTTDHRPRATDRRPTDHDQRPTTEAATTMGIQQITETAEYRRAAAEREAEKRQRDDAAAREVAERKALNDKLRSERLAKLDADEAAKRAADASAAVAAIEDRYRADYLRFNPGATEADFIAAWPDLLAEHRRREALDGLAREKRALAARGGYAL